MNILTGNDRRGDRQHPVLPPLPRDPAVIESFYKLKTPRLTTNQMVSALWLKMMQEDDFARLFEGAWDSQCVHGSCTADNHEGARLLLEEAINQNILGLKDENIATVVHALGVVTRSFGMDRKSRRLTVGAVVHQPDNAADESGDNNGTNSSDNE